MISTIKNIALLSLSAIIGLTSNAYATEDVVGNLSGEFTVNSGSLSYTLPIVTPEGIHGLRPNIAVTYNSSAGAGLLGAGFTLSASSSISRCNANVDVDGFKAGIEENNNARFCIDDEKLVAIAGENGAANTEYRNVEDNNTRYFSRGGNSNTPDYWEVQSPEGYKYTYNQVSATPTRFSGWYLTEKSDFFGNTINYTYSDELTPIIQQISYSGYTVDFNYEIREQSVGQYRDGHYFELDKRLGHIVLSRNNTEINRYRFIYETIIPDDGQAPLEPLEKLKRLSQVEKCYGPNGQEGCLRPLTFNYQEQPDPGLGLDHPEDRTIVVPRSYYANTDVAEGVELYERPSYTAADMNVDGLADFCYYKKDTGIMCALSNASGGYDAPAAWTGNLGYSATEEQYPYYSQVQLLDLNADTYPDFCLSDDTGIRCGLNNGGSGFTNVGYWLTALKHRGGSSLSFVDDDIYPDVCGLNGDASRYQCFSGIGTGFSSTPIVDLQNVVDYQFQASWQTQLCTDNPHNNEVYCNPEANFNPQINFPAAQWLDIDGDVDNDLCWLSTSQSALMCIYRSIDPVNHSLQFSAPQAVYSLNYSLTTVPSGSLGLISEVDSVSYQNNMDAVKDNNRRFISSFRISDVNGDLLPDICYASVHQFNCSINKGNGFAPATQWINVSNFYSGFTEDNDLSSLVTISLDDMNLDGLVDFCVIKNQQQYCAYNQMGSFGELKVRQSIIADMDTNTDAVEVYENFVRKIVDQIPGLGFWKTRYVTGTSNLAYGNLVNVPDINGDGYPEFCYRSIHGILCTSNDNYGAPARLIGITDSFGQTTEVTYGSLLSDGLYEAATATIHAGYYEQPYNSLVVDTVTVSTSVTESGYINTPIKNSQTYRYKGFLRNPVTGVSGFSAITVKQNERDVSTTMHLSLEEHLVGQQLFIEEYIGSALLKTKRNSYSVVNEANGTHRIRLDLVEEKQFDFDGGLVSTNTTTSANLDGYGYPQQATSIKTMAEDGETTTTTTTTEYFHDTQNWVLARPDLQTVIHQYGGETATRVVDYHFANGVMTGETIQPDASNSSSVEYTYDAIGNTSIVKTLGDGQERTVTKTFDSMGRVTSLTNSLGQSEHFTYHNTCPGVVSHTDAAGKVTSTTYDFACRQLQVNAPDNNATTWSYEWATADDNSSVNQPIDHPYDYRNSIVYKVTETHANGQWSKSSFDAQGRDVRVERVGFSSENFDRAVVNDSVYDRFGRKTATTLPYYRINGEYITPGWITVNYDAASRIVSEYKIGADGNPLTTTYSYDKNRTTLSYSDYVKTTQTGVFGKPLSIDENGLTIAYTYDPLGNLLTTNQNGVVTSVVYDARGFKVQQTDPAMGTWQYQYNAFGELVAQTDAKSQTTSFIYDELGRLIERTTPEGQTQWVYHTSGNGIGQLYQEQGIDATKQWEYDSLGRAISETLSVDGQQFVTQFTYDAYSRLEKTTNPNGLETYNDFDSTGALNKVSIPANQVQGFDVEHLKGEYEAILLELVEIEANIDSLEERRAYHLARSLEYESQAFHYIGLLNQTNEEIEQLTMLAQQHADLAARYQQAIDDLRAQAAAYRSLYGDRVFTYINTSNGQHNFRTIWCSDRHRIFGGCKTRQIKYVAISADNFNAIESGQPVYASYILPSVCKQVIIDEGDGVFTGPTYGTSCEPPQTVTQPTCVPSGYYEPAFGIWISHQACTNIRPHDIYTQAANDFAALRDSEIAKAATYQHQIDTEGASPLAPMVLTYEPTGQIVSQWVPIGIDIITFISVQVEETEAVWTQMSLEEAVVYYEDKIATYTTLAEEELASYNDLSQAWQDVATELDGVNTSQYEFAKLLQSAGILVGEDKSITELLDDAEAHEAEWGNSNQPLMVWSATMRAANGLVENEVFGNGLYTQRTIDHNTGLITSIETGAYSADTPLRKIDYTFDQRGMIIEKSDTTNTANSTIEQYDYDIQGRLRSWNFDQQTTGETPHQNQLWRTYDYDDRGNMTYKTGAGSMHYNAANQLTSRDVQAGLTVNYTYDANGNMQQGDGRNYQWNSFNKVSNVTMGNHTVNFDYDANHKRVVKKSNLETIYYVNPSYEKVIKHLANGGTEVIHRHNIWNGSDVVATFEKREEAAGEAEMGDDVKYYHRDHLGNGELVTGADMNVISHRFYTPYGELVEDVLQREQNASTQVAILLQYNTDDYMQELYDNNDAANDVRLLSEVMYGDNLSSDDFRGFTSHEEIKELGLVNMNARLYDPVIGRFISADSVITDISQPLDYNRYAYVRNNPMSYRDPNGHNPAAIAAAFAFFVGAHLTDNQSLQLLSTIVLTIALGQAFAPAADPGVILVNIAPPGAAAAAGSAFATSLTVGFLRTGDPKSSVKAAAFAALSAGVAHNIGDRYFGAEFGSTKWFQKAALHGATQGLISDLRGDGFSAGFVSGLASVTSSGFSEDTGLEESTAIAMVAGYISAEAVGGDGLQGALNAAIVHLYNNREHLGKRASAKVTGRDLTSARLSAAVYEVDESDIGSFTVDGYKLSKIYTDDSGLKAALFTGNDSSILAFAGTSPTSGANWSANLRQAFGLSSAQYNTGINIAISIEGPVHFTGHSLGGGIAAAAAIITGGSATTFNAAGVHSSTLRGFSSSGASINSYYSSFDLLRLGNALSPASVPGNNISLGAAGFHGMGGICNKVGC